MTPESTTAEDRTEAIRIGLSGIASAVDVGTIVTRLEPLHPRGDTFPGEVFLDLAARTIKSTCGTSRETPMRPGIRERYLPECSAHTKAQHRKSEFRDSGRGDDARRRRS